MLVTGAGRGLGLAYSRLLAARGARVVVLDAGLDERGEQPDPAVAAAVAGEVGGVACTSDLSSRDRCEAAVEFALERGGRLDALVHSAGLIAFAAIEETDPELVERMLAVNAAAPFWLARRALPHMQERGYGRIVFTVSGRALTLDAAAPDLAAYSLGKAAQRGLTVALAAEGAEHGVLVNAVSPAAATRMYRSPVGPAGPTPEQVAPAVAFLASSACDVSGVVLGAAGGRFSLGRWSEGAPIDLGRAPTPEDLLARRRELGL